MHLVALRSPADGGEAHAPTVVDHVPGGPQKHVVSLLGAQVGHRESQEFSVRYPQFGPHLVPDRRAPPQQVGDTGVVDTVDDDGGPLPQGDRQGVADRPRDGDEAAVTADARSIEQAQRQDRLVPHVVIRIDEHRSVPAGQRQRHQPPEGGGIGKVEVHEVVVPFDQKAAQNREPTRVAVAPGSEAVDRDTVRLHGGDE